MLGAVGHRHDRQLVELRHVVSQQVDGQQVGHHPHVGVGPRQAVEDLLDFLVTAARQGDEDNVDRALQDDFVDGVEGSDDLPVQQSAPRVVGLDEVRHADAGPGIVREHVVKALRQPARSDDDGVTQVPAAPAEAAQHRAGQQAVEFRQHQPRRQRQARCGAGQTGGAGEGGDRVDDHPYKQDGLGEAVGLGQKALGALGLVQAQAAEYEQAQRDRQRSGQDEAVERMGGHGQPAQVPAPGVQAMPESPGGEGDDRVAQPEEAQHQLVVALHHGRSSPFSSSSASTDRLNPERNSSGAKRPAQCARRPAWKASSIPSNRFTASTRASAVCAE